MFLAIVIIQVLMMFFWGTIKQGFHHDEVLTYQISNDLQYPDKLTLSWRENFYDEWHDKSYFNNALVAGDEHLFDYGSVYQKVAYDVCSPLFYYGIHTFCSLFPNSFSKWVGIIPNIFYFVVTQIALYAIGCRLCKSRTFGVLAVTAYGFSAAAISSVVFIRMYAMLSMLGGGIALLSFENI